MVSRSRHLFAFTCLLGQLEFVPLVHHGVFLLTTLFELKDARLVSPHEADLCTMPMHMGIDAD